MNTFQKASIIAATSITLAASAFAGVTPHEKNRQITRGSGAADISMTELSTVRGAKATPHTIIRHTRVAPQREALRNEVNISNAVTVSKTGKRMKTASQRTRNS